ncbi:MAG: HEAT repeat domain-containing protein [Pyrinomonadaceae bacterium]
MRHKCRRYHKSTCQLALSFIGLLVLAALAQAQIARAGDQDIQKLNRFMQTAKGNTAAMQIFREGRDFIEAQNWQSAADRFDDFIKGYPKDKDIDAALYWYGYALQKQGKKDEAATPLINLIGRFPNSTWRREAEATLVALGRQDAVSQASIRDNCEIKILALQGLFEADEQRAINFVADVLRTNSSQCPGLQAVAVSLLGAHGGERAVPMLLDIAKNQTDLRLRLTAIKRLGEQQNDGVTDELIRLYDVDKTKDLRIQILRALAESRSTRGWAKLMDVARSADDVTVRQFALRYLAESKDSGAVDELIRIYDTDQNAQIKGQVLRVLAGREDPKAAAKLMDIARTGATPELRVEAIRRLTERGRINVNDLVQLYNTETNVAIKQGLLRTYANMDDAEAKAKLLEVAKSGDGLELRTYAIRQLNAKDDPQVIDQLVAIYDSEQNIQVRAALLRAFGNSQQKNALHKLMGVARNDQSVDLRKIAVRYLGESKDPEALRFLEELLK